MLAEFIGVVWYVTGQFLHNVFLYAIVPRCITPFFMRNSIIWHAIMRHTSMSRFSLSSIIVPFSNVELSIIVLKKEILYN